MGSSFPFKTCWWRWSSRLLSCILAQWLISQPRRGEGPGDVACVQPPTLLKRNRCTQAMGTRFVYISRENICYLPAGRSVFLVFMWRNHIPKLNITLPSDVFFSSDKKPYSYLTFHNVLARQGSSNSNRPSLNFQPFALRDMTMTAREGCRVGQKMSYRFSFCYLNSACTRRSICFIMSDL